MNIYRIASMELALRQMPDMSAKESRLYLRKQFPLASEAELDAAIRQAGFIDNGR